MAILVSRPAPRTAQGAQTPQRDASAERVAPARHNGSVSAAELGFLVISTGLILMSLLLGRVTRQFHRDEIYTNLTPGMVPLPGAPDESRRVRGGQEYSDEVAVAFSPPKGLSPGLIGTVIDGRAEMRDVMATILDLAVRGHLTITAIGHDGDAPELAEQQNRPTDWQLELCEVAPPNDTLSDMERSLLQSVFSHGATTSMSAWSRSGEPRRFTESMYAQVQRNGWYRRDPRRRGIVLPTLAGIVGVGFSLLVLASQPTLFGLVAAGMSVGAAVIAIRALRGRVPRTASGSAVMIQSLGFKKYLATAEADQFSFEEAAGIFSRYLPYAIVFGVADHWSKVFGEVATRAHSAGADDLFINLMWFDLSGMDTLAAAALFGGMDGDFAGLFDVGGLGEITEGLSGFAESVGDFVSGIDFDF